MRPLVHPPGPPSRWMGRSISWVQPQTSAILPWFQQACPPRTPTKAWLPPSPESRTAARGDKMACKRSSTKPGQAGPTPRTCSRRPALPRCKPGRPPPSGVWPSAYDLCAHHRGWRQRLNAADQWIAANHNQMGQAKTMRSPRTASGICHHWNRAQNSPPWLKQSA